MSGEESTDVPFALQGNCELKCGQEELPSHGKCKFSAWKVKLSFHIVVSGLLWSLLNLKFHHKL